MDQCPLCGDNLGIDDSICLRCHRKFHEFCKNMPEGWKKITGDALVTPSFSEWEKEQYIKRALLDGKITEAEAKRRAHELYEQVRKRLNPTLEERIERARQAAEREARRPKFPVDLPSFFDD